MKIELIFPGKTKDKFIVTGITEYTRRLGHYTSVATKIVAAKVGRMANDTLAKEKEGDLLLRQVGKGSFIVALDSTGRQYSSTELSGLIDQWEQRSIGLTSFLIGGPLGLSGEVIQKADLVLSLSCMTFTHDMARMLLLEQLYRAYTIKRGEKYHK